MTRCFELGVQLADLGLRLLVTQSHADAGAEPLEEADRLGSEAIPAVIGEVQQAEDLLPGPQGDQRDGQEAVVDAAVARVQAPVLGRRRLRATGATRWSSNCRLA